LWKVILIAWFITLFEYQVPANRIGHGQFNAAQLKNIQEVITLIVLLSSRVSTLRKILDGIMLLDLVYWSWQPF